jgi:hypothetical protein
LDKKFPYGYDVNAYIDKAFEQIDLVSPGPFYVGRNDLENCLGLKEFLGYK